MLLERTRTRNGPGDSLGRGVLIRLHPRARFHRIEPQYSAPARPKTAIGFFPDVGASLFLPRPAPGWGRYLTGSPARGWLPGALSAAVWRPIMCRATVIAGARPRPVLPSGRRRSHLATVSRRAVKRPVVGRAGASAGVVMPNPPGNVSGGSPAPPPCSGLRCSRP
ncbi:enoyl-CoA hydratase/isomerase family protein [Streptomyces shenzhenensis]|uniref:enoyl-CoA hydratase/isomerase family protein n=1 Tax=Streptomyces shenzhenensis TaxID=943815 RepID=UPI0037F84836